MNLSSLTYKIIVLLGLTLALLLPTWLIVNLVYEREASQAKVVRTVSNGTSAAQRVVGPVLVVPYQAPAPGGGYENKTMYILPDVLKANADIRVEPRKVGIYQAQMYQGEMQMSGAFSVPVLEPGAVAGTPYLSVGTSDARGLRAQGAVTLGGSSFAFESGTRIAALPQGMHAPFALSSYQQPQTLEFRFKLGLMGTESLAFVPLGNSSTLTLKSNWPHPSFSGEFLPVTHQVTHNGFNASWDTASGITDKVQRALSQADAGAFDKLPAYSTGLIETVNQYQLNLRAVKYAILFIGLTFLMFFMFEILKSLRVHPVQYALVGMALVLFYLLLLALSEHIGFNLAYLIASGACVGQIVFYSRYVLAGLGRALGLGTLLATLYAVLWAVLQAEDMALLLGSVLLFCVLTLMMILTRHLDWYRLGQPVQTEHLGYGGR